MKTFKLIDVLVSTSLITVFLIVTLIRPDTLFYGYFIVGGWQVISMIVHAYFGWFTPKGSIRRGYHTFVFILLAVGAVCMLVSFLSFIVMILAYVLLIFAPIMAVWYTSMCYNEWKKLSQRPIAVLK